MMPAFESARIGLLKPKASMLNNRYVAGAANRLRCAQSGRPSVSSDFSCEGSICRSATVRCALPSLAESWWSALRRESCSLRLLNNSSGFHSSTDNPTNFLLQETAFARGKLNSHFGGILNRTRSCWPGYWIVLTSGSILPTNARTIRNDTGCSMLATAKTSA